MIKAKVGDIIRSYDFKPMVGREDCFVEGEVLETQNTEHGYSAFKIRVTKDVFDGKEFKELAYKEVEKHRVGDFVFVPHKVSFMEYAGRVINLSE
jgi:5-formaminoimidazole-4-carboxamide-1-beta-D-ribofuranosyl 5'-monophosphate synthetase